MRKTTLLRFLIICSLLRFSSGLLPDLHWHNQRHKHMGVSKNRGTPKSSILIGFSIINHPFWGTPIFGNTLFLISATSFLGLPQVVCLIAKRDTGIRKIPKSSKDVHYSEKWPPKEKTLLKCRLAIVDRRTVLKGSNPSKDHPQFRPAPLFHSSNSPAKQHSSKPTCWLQILLQDTLARGHWACQLKNIKNFFYDKYCQSVFLWFHWQAPCGPVATFHQAFDSHLFAAAPAWGKKLTLRITNLL